MPDQITQKIFQPDQAANMASTFVGQWRLNQNPDFGLIDQLGELSLKADRMVADQAVSALYGTIVEGLCDDFSSSGVSVCNRVLLRLLEVIRPYPAGEDVWRLLGSLGYPTSGQLLGRCLRLCNRKTVSGNIKKRVKKIFILSRVTVGADVAVTSVFVQRLLHAFPQAELELIGPAHLAELFHGLERVSCLIYQYQRRGSLLERLTSWPDIYHLVHDLCRGLGADEILLFDPDSRLSQLGLLPLLAEESTCYFNSRSSLAEGNEDLSLSQMANNWFNDILAENFCSPPAVFIDQCHEQTARSFYDQWQRSVLRVAVNLGVGKDGRKRVADPFEEELLFALLGRKDTLLFFDTGCDREEKCRAEQLAHKVRERGVAVERVRETELAAKKIVFSHGMIVFEGGISSLTAMLKQNHIFFGYDSCCQHLVTAIGVPAVIGFAGAPHQRFRARWQPRNPVGSTITLPIDNREPDRDGRDALIEEIIAAMGRAGKVSAASMCGNYVNDFLKPFYPKR